MVSDTRGLRDTRKLLQEVRGEPEEEGSVGLGQTQGSHYWPFAFPGLQEGEELWGPLSKTHLLADMTFIHEGNHTLVENLINFEKMVSSRTVRVCP